MNYIDLFHGVGGFALAAYWAGMKFENHFCSDIEPYCVDLYKLRFPDSIQLGDITKIDTTKLPDGEWVLSGGFPCPDISIAGKREGLNGDKSVLWFEYLRIIRDLRPMFAIIENVGALTNWFDCERRPTPPENYNGGDRWELEVEQYQGLASCISSLAEIGYNAEWQDIRAEDVGAPHKREREWIVAYPNSKRLQGENKSSKQNEEWEAQAIKRWEITGQNTEWWDIDPADLPDTDQFDDDMGGPAASEILQSEQTEVSGCEISDTDKKLGRGKRRWIGSSGKNGIIKHESWPIKSRVGRVAHGIPHRVDRLKGLGNAIVPQIATLLFRRIKELIES